MNDRERELWIDNDEWLYLNWKDSRLSKRQFIRGYRPEITRVIEERLRGKHETSGETALSQARARGL